MKRVLLIATAVVAALALGAATYVVWFVRRAVTDDVQVSVRSPGWQDDRLNVELRVSGGSSDVVVTEIAMPRQFAESVGLARPAGFAPAPLELEAEEKGDRESEEFVTRYNLENVRYTGQLPLSSDGSTQIQFRAARPTAAGGTIEFDYQRKVGLGGQLGRARLMVAGPPASKAP